MVGENVGAARGFSGKCARLVTVASWVRNLAPYIKKEQCEY